MSHPTRRHVLTGAPLGAAALFALPAGARAADEPPPAPPDSFPSQDPPLVREMVGVAHGNLDRVNALLAERPTLSRAAWDWGFGDWESALGAASHVGNRPIADLLLRHGARPSIFSAAMLGQLAVVQAFVAAQPGVQRTKGPHGITLLAHAVAGGDAALPVREYLERLGDADPRPTPVELTAAERERLLGDYRFGGGERDVLQVTLQRGSLMLGRLGGAPRGLTALSPTEFFPAGADAVRIRFGLSGERASEVRIFDPGLVVAALR